MIICSNCGTINNDELGRFCRKCGALLPFPTKSSKVKLTLAPDSKSNVKQLDSPTIDAIDEKKSKKETAQKDTLNHIPGEVRLFSSQKKIEVNFLNQELEEIPKPQSIIDNIDNQENGLQEIKEESLEIKATDNPIEHDNEENKKNGFLKEISPTPFHGTILSAKSTHEPSKLNSKNIPKVKYLNVNSNIKTNQQEQNSQDLDNSTEVIELKKSDSSLKMKQLEDDMSEVLSIISKKMKISKKDESAQTPPIKKDTLKKIPPSNMTDILNQLLKLDKYIEASAIIKEDGTILASVLSNRISDSLFATIGQNLSMIGSDIIEGLSAGNLTSISIKGSEGILDIAQVDKKNPQLKDMILIIFSHARVKSGIIAFATKIMKNQIIEYLNLNK